jgi:cell wall assembly regulator SMI1
MTTRTRWIGIGLVVVAACIVWGVVSIPRAVGAFFYPPAGPMPPIVSQTEEQILVALESALKNKAPQVLSRMQPGLSETEITNLEQQAGVRLSDEMRQLYHWRNGYATRDPLIVGPIPGHRFVPLAEALGLAAILTNQVAKVSFVQRAAFEILAGQRKSWITLFDDGCGDGYFFDHKRKPAEGAIFYSFAQDRTYIFFPSLKNLLAGAVKCYEQGAYYWTNAPAGGSLAEDFDKTEAIWHEFGSSPID